MLEAWVIATFVLFTTSFWEEDRRLVISAFFPLAEGIVEIGCGRNICSPRVKLGCRGTFGVTSKVLSTVSNFKTERETSLETL